MAVESGPASAVHAGRERDRAEYVALVRDAAGGNRAAMERLLLLAISLAAIGYVAVIAVWRLHVWWSWRKRQQARLGAARH